MEKIYNVTLLNQYIKNLIEGDFKLANVLVVGEICNLNKHYTGHYYFSIIHYTQIKIKFLLKDIN